MKATAKFNWSKVELLGQIDKEAHLKLVLDVGREVCANCSREKDSNRNSIWTAVLFPICKFMHIPLPQRCRGRPKKYRWELCSRRRLQIIHCVRAKVE